MNILAVETTSATGSLSIATVSGDSARILATRTWQKKSMHSEVITVELLEALSTAGLELQNLTHACIDVGPGSFTGIRVGINLVRTLAYALDVPVRIFSALEVLAWQRLRDGQSATIAIPAIRKYYYAALVAREGNRVALKGPVQSIELPENSTAPESFLVLPDEIPHSESLVSLFAADSKNPSFFTWKDVIPLYIRSSEAEEKLRKGLLKPLP
jgi:tRNA threonylcarbamoyladenosine biosynthesis protein TsaB